MRYRNILGTLAVMSVTALAGAAPASAQTPTPPCNPVGMPATAAVNCVIDDAEWAENLSEQADEIFFATLRATFDQAVTEASNAVRFATETQDAIEQAAIDAVCAQIELPADRCPQG